MVSGWLPAGDLLEGTSERLESDWEPVLPEVGAWDESLEGACEDEERLFCSLSLFSSSRSVLLSLSVSAFVSFLSRCGDGEDDDEEEELEEDDEEEEDLRGWGTSFGGRCSFTFSLSCSASLCLILSCSLSLALSRERERLLLLRRCGEGERRDLLGGLRLLGLLDRDLLRLLELLDLLLLATRSLSLSLSLSLSFSLSLSLSLCLSLSRSDQAGGGEALLDRDGGS